MKITQQLCRIIYTKNQCHHHIMISLSIIESFFFFFWMQEKRGKNKKKMHFGLWSFSQRNIKKVQCKENVFYEYILRICMLLNKILKITFYYFSLYHFFIINWIFFVCLCFYSFFFFFFSLFCNMHFLNTIIKSSLPFDIILEDNLRLYSHKKWSLLHGNIVHSDRYIEDININ